jgi:hypothetical protein
MTEIAFDRLKQERWTVSEGLSFFTLNDKKMSERSLLVAQLNYWQSIKWRGRFELVQKEVEAADFSAKDDLFQLARHALLDDSVTFFRLVPSAIKNGKLTKEMLATWPMFREMRKDDRFKKYRAKARRTPPEAGKKIAQRKQHGKREGVPEKLPRP